MIQQHFTQFKLFLLLVKEVAGEWPTLLWGIKRLNLLSFGSVFIAEYSNVHYVFGK